MVATFLNHRRKKYLLLLPIVILLLNAYYFQYASKNIQDTILKEKYIETVNHVNMLTTAVEANESRFWEDHEQNIVGSIEFLDSLPMAFAATYKPINNELILITAASHEPEFDPLAYDGFINAVASQDSGGIELEFKPDDGADCVMHLYFKHMPMYAPPEERYLVVAGVSKYSVVTSIPAWVSAGQWASMLVTFLLNVWMVVLITRLGVVCELRDSEERRDGGDNHV